MLYGNFYLAQRVVFIGNCIRYNLKILRLKMFHTKFRGVYMLQLVYCHQTVQNLCNYIQLIDDKYIQCDVQLFQI